MPKVEAVVHQTLGAARSFRDAALRASEVLGDDLSAEFVGMAENTVEIIEGEGKALLILWPSGKPEKRRSRFGKFARAVTDTADLSDRAFAQLSWFLTERDETEALQAAEALQYGRDSLRAAEEALESISEKAVQTRRSAGEPRSRPKRGKGRLRR